MKDELRTAYFTFGQSHVHRLNGITFDCDILVKITAPEPRDIMVAKFGQKWAKEYDQPPKPQYWPRGMVTWLPHTRRFFLSR